MIKPLSALSLLTACALSVGCSADYANPAPPASEHPLRQGIVDSIFPVEEAVRRFRATLPYEPSGLEDAVESRDALVQRFVTALEAADRDALVRLVMNRAEFGYLYYQHTRYTRPPYELPPQILWMQMQNRSGRGLTRLLHRVAGRPLPYRGYRCPDDPVREGPNRLWSECRVRLADPHGEEVEARLFGSIIERDGRYKFVSYSNEL